MPVGRPVSSDSGDTENTCRLMTVHATVQANSAQAFARIAEKTIRTIYRNPPCTNRLSARYSFREVCKNSYTWPVPDAPMLLRTSQ
jgi:hypothetical protein